MPEPHTPCERCGSPGPFKSPGSRRCIACDDTLAAQRREYLRLYHRARSRAESRLVAAHREEFQFLWDQALVEVKAEEKAKTETATTNDQGDHDGEG